MVHEHLKALHTHAGAVLFTYADPAVVARLPRVDVNTGDGSADAMSGRWSMELPGVGVERLPATLEATRRSSLPQE